MDRLITNAKAKSKKSVNDLWERYENHLLKTARVIYFRRKEFCTRNGLTIEDLQQETYLAFVDALEHFKRDTVEEFTKFLFSIIVYRLISLYNGHRGGKSKIIRIDGKTQRVSADPISSGPLSTDEKIQEDDKNSRDFGDYFADWKATAEYEAIEERIFAAELRVYIKEAIEKLPREERQIIQLIYFKDLTEEQTAQHLNLSETEVRMKMRAALLRLRCNKKIQWCWHQYKMAY